MENATFLSICSPSFFQKKPIIHDDSRLIAPGDIFVLHQGNRNFVSAALKASPSFVLFYENCADALDGMGGIRICNLPTEAEELVRLPAGLIGAIPIEQRVQVKDLLKSFYGQTDIAAIAITGTNGKTSATTFARQILSGSGLQSISIEGGSMIVGGNVGMKLGLGLTTPSIYDMHKALYIGKKMYGAEAIVFEASSHGIEQDRIGGIVIKTAAFTNLSQDHLDYHLTMEAYFSAKKQLFSEHLSQSGVAVLNQDIPEFSELRNLCQQRGVEIITYGKTGGDVQLISIEANEKGQNCRYNIAGKELLVQMPIFGAFQGINLACSMAICLNEIGGEIYQYIESAVAHLEPPNGRMQPVLEPDGTTSNVYIDYAHTPDAVKVVLSDIRNNGNGRIITVLGCGGDRDSRKRPLMGEIASSLSDLVFITDDNPRTENPAKIRAEMIKGVAVHNRPKVIEITTGRHDAIMRAVGERKRNDVVVILGKGHEDCQIIGLDRIPFSDHKVASTAVRSFKVETGKHTANATS